MSIVEFLRGKKTFLVAFLMALVPVLDAFDVLHLTDRQLQAVELLLGALLGTTIRLGVAKAERAARGDEGRALVALLGGIALVLIVLLPLVGLGCVTVHQRDPRTIATLEDAAQACRDDAVRAREIAQDGTTPTPVAVRVRGIAVRLEGTADQLAARASVERAKYDEADGVQAGAGR